MKKLLFLLMAVSLLLASCEGMFDPAEKNQTGSVTISLSETVSRTLEPELSMDPDYIVVMLCGPNGECLEETVEGGKGEIIFSGLKHGNWTISGCAYNEDDTFIGKGEESCIVKSGETSNVNLIVSALDGEGCLELEAYWNVSDVETPVIVGQLTDCSGETTNLVLLLDEEEGTAVYGDDLENGYYSLTLSLYDDDYLCTGAMEIVRIVAGEITAGSFDFTDLKVNYGSIDVNIDVSLENPLYPLIEGGCDLIGVSEPVVLTADMEEDLEGVVYVWYVDGMAKASGENFTFLTEETGPYRIDLAAFSSDGARAGSTGFSLLVSGTVQSYMKISEVQGDSHTSPYVDQSVEDVLGVVTAVESRGFWMQSPTGDGDDNTSEGIYVFTYSAHTQSVGDLVLVDGTVQEYGYEGALKLTELNYVTVETLQSGYALPEAVVIGTEGILPPEEFICNDSVYDGPFDPSEDGIDFYECLEGMLVEIDNPVVIGGTKYGEIPVIPRNTTYGSATVRGGLILTEENANPQRMHIDTDAALLGLDPVSANMGDFFNEPVKGIISYDYGKFLLLPTYLPEVQSNPVARETTDLPALQDRLTVATFNMENFPRDDENMTTAEIEDKILDIAQTIVEGLGSPDILAVQEMTDDSFSEDDGTVTAEENARRLTQMISNLGGPVYEYVDIEPEDKKDGGWEEANIRVAYLYNPERVGFTPVGNGGTFDETEVISSGDDVSLSLNPGRFSLASFGGSRKSLAAQFEFNGESVFLINNHLCSKGGDDYLFGENQPPVLSSEEERHVQAAAVRNMAADLIEAGASVIVMGDMNDFQFSDTLGIIEESGLVSLTDSLLEEKERYSYVYYGNSQQLDHLLVSPNLLNDALVDIVHRYAEYDSETRHSDHDPILCSLSSEEETEEGTLFFSEYAEGSSNNKYVEIYNPLSREISLEGYQVIRYNNGNTEPSGTYDLSGSLVAGEMYIIMNADADASIVAKGDTALSGVTWYNGDDCLRLVNGEGDVIDQIGIWGEDPGSAWEAAGFSGATGEHTLVRKASVTKGNGGDWTASAGSDEDDSEWLVYDQDYWENLTILAE